MKNKKHGNEHPDYDRVIDNIELETRPSWDLVFVEFGKNGSVSYAIE